MELTNSQIAALDDIRFEFLGASCRAPDFNMRPSTKAEFRGKRDKLKSLMRIWSALDLDTQWYLVCGLNAMWTDDVEDLLPDITPVVESLLEQMEKPSGAPEQLLGIRRAVALLWTAWCEQQPGGNVPIGRVAIVAIGSVLTSVYGIDAPEAERRVRHTLRDLEKGGFLERRGTTRRAD